jgi:mono/diheme cytochrome c family protein
MSRRPVFFLAALIWTGAAAGSVPRAQTPQIAPLPPASAAADPRDTLTRYCVTCHNERAKTGGLVLETLDFARIPDHADVWEKVLVKLRTGAMPPAGVPRPDRATYDSLIAWLETTIDRAAGPAPDPGRTLLHRLNRAEYANAIRDLLALDVDVATLLPPDDSSYGFDNIADILGVSPALQERYLSAADKISALAVGTPEVAVAGETIYQVPADRTQRQHIDGLPLGTRGGILIRYTAPLDGEYLIKPRLWKTNNSIIRGLTLHHQLEIAVDGKRVHLATVGGTTPYVDGAELVNTGINERLQVRLPLKAGPRVITVAFLHKSGTQSPEVLQPFESALDPVDAAGVPQVDVVTITGPFSASGPGETPSRSRIFTCRPASRAQEASCARSILAGLARRAYRRPVTDADVQALTGFFDSGREDGGSFEHGIRVALQRILADPEFMFRIERDPADAAPGSAHRITDLELASRLSFFLWSSIPDEELLTLASSGKLGNAAVLAQQVRRMMADRRAEALVSNFAGQWLYLRNLRNQQPDRMAFPDFDDNLRQAFRRETELFFQSIIQDDRNVLDLMTADYTFVNDRLAKHYGIPNVYGSHFRRVTLTDETRRGLLGKGSVLMVTSRAERTSPVLRGKWVLENLLGTSPPAPPPDVPPFPETDGAQPKTVRERLELHRANPTCASCHKLMDPLGLALENFDAVGGWRTKEGGHAIDASDQLFDGTKVDGPIALRKALLSRPENFVQTLTEKLMIYALGRGLTHADMPMVRAIVREASRQEYRFSSIVLGIVKSPAFQMRMTQRIDKITPVAGAGG